MDISSGKLQQLVTVARTGSFSKAAIELNISQPALSRSIAALEDRYGFQIFNRKGHGVQLTAAGAQVIEHAGPLLQKLHVFDNNLRLIGSGKAGTLSIGMAPLLASQLLGQFAGDFFNASTFNDTTQAELRATVRAGAELVERLKNDVIELFFCPETYIAPDAELEIEPVGEMNSVCVVRRDHPLTGQGAITTKALQAYPWASSVTPPLLEESRLPAQFICDNYHILKQSVMISDLVCICSRAFVAEELRNGSLQVIEVTDLPLENMTINAVKLRGRVSSPLALAAIQRVRDYLTSQMTTSENH